jgi:hypothetical protein
LAEVGSHPESLDFRGSLAGVANLSESHTPSQMIVEPSHEEGPGGEFKFIKRKTVVIRVTPITATEFLEGAVDQRTNSG